MSKNRQKEEKMKKVQTQKNNGSVKDVSLRIMLFAFAIPVLITLVIFIIRGVFPFGERSFLASDMYHQYMPFFSEFMHKLGMGDSLNFTYNVGIGSNFLALYVYYLASPLHWLGVLVPEKYLIEFLTYLVVVKIGLVGMSGCYYLQKHFGRKDFATCLFAIFYAMSGFMAAYNWNIMWLDCVILLPLIMLGLEKLVNESKGGMYCLMLGFCIFTNYYISIMICLFLVFYFGVLLLSAKKKWRACFDFAFYSVLAGGLACVLLVPEVCAILRTDFGAMEFPNSYKSYFSIIDMLARHCVAVSPEKGLDHWPNIYCGTFVFMMIPMYALNDKISIKKRFGMLGLAGFILYGFSANVPNFIWHGLNYPDSLPARQSFIYSFLLIVMSYEVYHTIKQADKKAILHGYLIAAGFLLLCEKFVDHEDFITGIQLITLLFVTAYAVLLYCYQNKKSSLAKGVILAFTVIVVVTEVTVNAVNTTYTTTNRTDYLKKQQAYKDLYQYTQENENSIYRIELFTRLTKNDGTLAGYPTATVFSSTLNSQVMNLYKRLGMRYSKVFYSFEGATPLTSALLNVNYMFGDSEEYENPLFCVEKTNDEVYLYKNQVTLPFGYVAPPNFDLPEDDKESAITVQNKMVRELLGGKELFAMQTANSKDDDVVFTAKEDGIYYAQMSNGGTSKLKIMGGSPNEVKIKDLKKSSIVYLGYLKEGQIITLSNDDTDDSTPKVSAGIYRLNEEALEQVIEKLSQNHLVVDNFGSDYINGHISMDEAGRVILSVPCEKGWQVLVNGESVEPSTFGDALVAFDFEPGEYEIAMKYIPEGKYLGMILSFISLLLFCAITFLKKSNKKHLRN